MGGGDGGLDGGFGVGLRGDDEYGWWWLWGFGGSMCTRKSLIVVSFLRVLLVAPSWWAKIHGPRECDYASPRVVSFLWV